MGARTVSARVTRINLYRFSQHVPAYVARMGFEPTYSPGTLTYTCRITPTMLAWPCAWETV